MLQNKGIVIFLFPPFKVIMLLVSLQACCASDSDKSFRFNEISVSFDIAPSVIQRDVGSLFECGRICIASSTQSFICAGFAYNLQIRTCDLYEYVPEEIPGKLVFKNFDYPYFYYTDRELTFVQSQQRCADTRGTLMRFDFSWKYDAFLKHLQQLSVIHHGAWVGLNDIDNEGTFVFDDGTIPPNQSFYKWKSGQPDNSNSNEDCVCMVMATSQDIELWDIPCNLERFGVCEKLPVR